MSMSRIQGHLQQVQKGRTEAQLMGTKDWTWPIKPLELPGNQANFAPPNGAICSSLDGGYSSAVQQGCGGGV